MNLKNRLMQRVLMLLPLTLLLSACMSKPDAWQHEPVSAVALPPLPTEARQPEPPTPLCLPSCSKGLTEQRGSWLQLMTEQGPQG